MGKRKTIDSYFQRKKDEKETIVNESNSDEITHSLIPDTSTPVQDQQHAQTYRVECSDFDELERDPALRKQIDTYHCREHDRIRREYAKLGPYQFVMPHYPTSGPENHPRRFQSQWFKNFPWLEYSPISDAAYCFLCFLFQKKPIGKVGSDTFIVKGFRNWRKVNSGKDCPFLCHMGKYANSAHGYAVQCLENLKNSKGHIEKIVEKQTSEDVAKNRLRLTTSIDIVRWLTFQKCAFRGHDEKVGSKNQGNFKELLNLLASYNKEVHDVLEKAPLNAKYTSPDIQKEILHVFAQNVQAVIRKEIGNAKFSIIVDESRDISKREQMAIVVRFVATDGILKERFLDLVHVKDTSSMTLKEAITSRLAHHNLSIQNLRGQGYDGASNMRGEWNGLQALFMKDCPYAYYVHCLAHQLQLALIAAAREVAKVHDFFKNLNFIVNTVSSSSKRSDELRASHITELQHLIEIEEVETGRGLNQIGTLQRPGDTRWSSHFKSICSVIRMFGATRTVLEKIATDRKASYSQRGDADSSLRKLLSFDFLFILHVMQEIMGITDQLCQALQQQSQDILNAMSLVSSTKILIQTLRDDGWRTLLENVMLFCEKHEIHVPNMNVTYSDIIRSRHNKDNVTVMHHYRVDVFTAAIDQQLQELNNRFSEHSTELLILSAALDPIDGFKNFCVDKIYSLVEKYYPEDFSEQEKLQLKFQLQHFRLNVVTHPELKKLSTIVDLCEGLVKYGISTSYPLIRLILTLPVSTATSERAFSAMNIVKTVLRNRMEDDFLSDYLIVYIEKEIAKNISTDLLIKNFDSMKSRRARLM